MASTARSKSEKKEFFDEEEVLDKKVKELAEVIRKSKHLIAFTGAGISTAAGIPDFRSGINTVLDTGPGKWEKQANPGFSKLPKRAAVATIKAFPTFTHMALQTLIDKGIMKFLISQNTDGLHRRSGIPKRQLAELHGNGNLEICKKCKAQYLRDFRTRNSKSVHNHETGRKCDNPACKGALKDTIINFGEDLPPKEFAKAEKHSEMADVCLALGSSLTVTPAADCPETVGKLGHLYIINLQRTPLDSLSTRLNGKCDEVMRKLMEELEIEVPPWRLHRGVRVDVQPIDTPRGSKDHNLTEISIEGFDPNSDTPYHLFKRVDIMFQKDDPKQARAPNVSSASAPFRFNLTDKQMSKIDSITCAFMGNYDEPELRNIPVRDAKWDIRLDFETKEWIVDERKQELVMN